MDLKNFQFVKLLFYHIFVAKNKTVLCIVIGDKFILKTVHIFND